MGETPQSIDDGGPACACNSGHMKQLAGMERDLEWLIIEAMKANHEIQILLSQRITLLTKSHAQLAATLAVLNKERADAQDT